MTVNLSKSPGMRRQPRQARSQERVNQILDVAEQMFIAEGYAATTTNAIAKGAKVSIGSLYQFFPDKTAILHALTMRYVALLRERFTEFHEAEALELSLSDYVDHVIDGIDQFFTDYPGYHAIFMQVQGTMPEFIALDNAADAQYIEAFAAFFAQTYPGLEVADYEAIAFVIVKAIGNLLWLSLSQTPNLRQRLVVETKRLMLSYLQSYLSEPLN
ncbi:MAG: TetR/AcrR family transcriptional regulator [Cyanobacteria bacterium P01_A01_bin.123]